ncbi:MAG TPA: NAD(P)-binding domain-containing protein [Negativicutes bacterium]|nr:NAD(P)-binding domain-containing protein [Negativicutes bacterium]
MKLGFIGFGEVAYEMAAGLKKEGISGIVAFDPMKDDLKIGKLVKERAESAGVHLYGTPIEVVRQADVIIAAVPGSKALQAALEAAAALDEQKIYVDVSTSSPKTKKKIAEIVHGQNASFVDAGLMGGLTLLQHKVPAIISGRGSDRFIQLMSPYHMSLQKVSDVPGDAIAIKLVRSIYMKGIATLAVEMLETASSLNVAPLVIESIAETMNSKPFEAMMNFLVNASAIHAERQAHEMTDVMGMMHEMGIESTMTKATKERLQSLAAKNLKEKFQGKKPERWEEVIVG